MKNIIISGVPRSGKTTLSKRLHKELSSYNFIEEDRILTSIIVSYKESSLCKNGGVNSKYIIDMNFINKFANMIKKVYLDSCCNDFNYILDSSNLSMEDLKKYINNGDIVIVLGYPRLTREQLFYNIREHDTSKDRTYHMGDNFLLMEINKYIDITKEQKKECQKLNIPYYDISTDREKNLDDIFKYIMKRLKKYK